MMQTVRNWLAMLTVATLVSMGAQPARAAKMPQEAASTGDASAEIAQIHQDVATFGAWLLRLNGTMEPLLESIRGLQAKWAVAAKASSPAITGKMMKPSVVELKARIAATASQLHALDRPQIKALQLGDEFQPAALIEESLHLLGQFDQFANSIEAMMAGMSAGNKAAFDAGARQMFVALGLIYQTQQTLTTAYLATVDQNKAEYDAILVERNFFAAGTRIIQTAELMMKNRADPGFPADLERLAAEFEVIAVRGRGRLDTEIAAFQVQQASHSGQHDLARMLGKAIGGAQVERKTFDIAEQFAKQLRESAVAVRKARTTQSILGVASHLGPVRTMLDQVVIQQAAIMAQ